ncbi:uncharacterized protein B0H18DRAFT_1119942 [Fomitopsis serialis]|uniref:uncharacterized protein n=1 Tax=Fomitopsis serialis TaxID=139415 RepID=UPI0020085515|nr:uncharacterized protein B0H18DRAFT_1119942 [Neoantrodia serialis]KAH9924407.1 hypothetical protein B0H18DRAFT_1119942 [Neoantrodia serialis]
MSTSSLPDHVDRLSLLARSIRANAAATAPETSGPFTEAVLRTPLGDLIRDIDPAEMGLFTVIAPSKPAVSNTDVPPPPEGELARVEFHGATPLKKPPAPRPGRLDGQRAGEHEPEVYARAAVKYLDRYRSIRPMPRASEQAERIMAQLSEVRDNMRKLSEQLKEHAASDPHEVPASPKSIIMDEEQRILAARDQITELKKRKETLLRQKAAVPKPPRSRHKPRPQTPPSAIDEQEETFWNTPGAAARTLHFTGDSLLDEEVHVADMSNLSFSSPVPVRRSGADTDLPERASDEEELEAEMAADEPVHTVDEDSLSTEEVLDEDDSDPTVKLRPPLKAISPPVEDTAVQEAASPPATVAETPDPHKRAKVRVTTELEQIVAKIWATIGDQIKAGHANSGKPLRAKETLAILHQLSNSTPAPSSPSISLSSFSATAPVSTTSAQPSAQQILTAHMLLTLLSSPPTYSMPFGRIKEALSDKVASIGIRASAVGGAGITRPVYGCVAKRLLKIERGAGSRW